MSRRDLVSGQTECECGAIAKASVFSWASPFHQVGRRKYGFCRGGHAAVGSEIQVGRDLGSCD